MAGYRARYTVFAVDSNKPIPDCHDFETPYLHQQRDQSLQQFGPGQNPGVVLRHNKALGVTGMLLYASGYFMQVLEGEPDSVADIYGRIAKDARHTDLAVLSNEPIAKRSFSQWNMGYRGLTQEDASTHPSLAPFFSKGFDANVIGAAPGRALSMLRLFAMS